MGPLNGSITYINSNIYILIFILFFFLLFATLYLKTASWNKRERSFSLLRPPAATQVGVSDDGLLAESWVEVKDDILAFDEVNMEPAGKKIRSLVYGHASVILCTSVKITLYSHSMPSVNNLTSADCESYL